MADVCLRSQSALHSLSLVKPLARPTYVDLRILEPLLQIIIDSLVRYLTDEGKI